MEVLHITEDWEFRLLSDASAVVFNPYTGDLHALAELPARLVEAASGFGFPFEKLLDTLVADFQDVEPLALEREAWSCISSLIEIGVISAVTDPAGQAGPAAAD